MKTFTLRILLSLALVYCLFASVKDLPLILVGLIRNTGPLFAVVFGYLLLKEKISVVEILSLILAFARVFIMIYFKPTEEEKKKNALLENQQTFQEYIVSLILLILVPLIQSLTNITQRQLRDLSEYCSNAYIPLITGLLFGSIFYFTNQDFTFVSSFDVGDYFILYFSSFLGLMGLLTKAKAFKNESVSRLSILNYLQLVILVLFDFFLFDLSLGISDIVGITIILGANFIATYYALSQSDNDFIKAK